MTKGKDLPSYIHRRKRDGVLLFRKRVAGKIIEVRLETQFPEGTPVPFALHQERERLIAQPEPVAIGKDMASVLKQYKSLPKFGDLAPRTRSDYDKHLQYFADKLGTLSPKQIERYHVIAWRDAWAKQHSPHFANYRARVLSIVLEHAKDMGLLKKTDENPAKGLKALKYEKQERQEWPAEKVEGFRKAFGYGTRERTCFELCLGTGQRIGDVLKMQWSHIRGASIAVKQSKTGKRLEIPMTEHLRAALAAADRNKESLFILPKDMSKTKTPGPWAYRSAAQAMRKAREAVGAQAYDLHSLRYTAGVELLLAGCSDDQIGSITGQSLEMVRHYTKSVRQRARAEEAQRKRENVTWKRT
ncbi:site-specific tyrosine recombinase XerC [Pelagimonas phthalicica]|uniref:Site-specific tyrosine recombinase XerC n=1 Tax=Pelagimonas phthalicica TaxID=1037362 RepID=A0A238J969_9RHOB|nr:tyrosine-type recombinase/integrase [Pelagimonas phthalicica]TDS94215.1 phage integrase family protein [Pelagimonas phthalicica]SMX27260.1 site-specific tyrosine recombinase XerC [Pelagimonas phthalicica]